jgi:hypothetical protein
VRRLAVGALALGLFAVTAVHALGRHAGGGCPFGFARPTAHAAALRGATVARTRPALGLALDRTTAAELAQWAKDRGVACAPHHGAIACSHVPDSTLELTSVEFRLAADGTLDAIRVVRRQPDPRAVAAAFSAIDRALTTASGPAWARQGTLDTLAAAPLRQASVEYRFTDYRAVIRATNLGDGFVLSEDYASLVDQPAGSSARKPATAATNSSG